MAATAAEGKPPGAGKVTQKLFDELVEENVEEFEMERQEAVEDAIMQLKAQVRLN